MSVTVTDGIVRMTTDLDSYGSVEEPFSAQAIIFTADTTATGGTQFAIEKLEAPTNAIMRFHVPTQETRTILFSNPRHFTSGIRVNTLNGAGAANDEEVALVLV